MEYPVRKRQRISKTENRSLSAGSKHAGEEDTVLTGLEAGNGKDESITEPALSETLLLHEIRQMPQIRHNHRHRRFALVEGAVAVTLATRTQVVSQTLNVIKDQLGQTQTILTAVSEPTGFSIATNTVPYTGPATESPILSAMMSIYASLPSVMSQPTIDASTIDIGLSSGSVRNPRPSARPHRTGPTNAVMLSEASAMETVPSFMNPALTGASAMAPLPTYPASSVPAIPNNATLSSSSSSSLNGVIVPSGIGLNMSMSSAIASSSTNTFLVDPANLATNRPSFSPLTAGGSMSTTLSSSLKPTKAVPPASTTSPIPAATGVGIPASPGSPINGENGPGATGSPGQDGKSSMTATPVVVGGVVGGVAGFAFILVLILFFLRRYREGHQAGRMIRHGESDASSAGAMAIASDDPSQKVKNHRFSYTPFGAAAMIRKFRPGSQLNASSAAAPSERGFYRVSGRKLPPVLGGAGGDGYGGGIPNEVMSETSFHRESQGTFRGMMTPPEATSAGARWASEVTNTAGAERPPKSPASANPRPEDHGDPVLRSSPARTPGVVVGPSLALPGTLSSGAEAGARRPRPRDGVGRSHPSHDGSRGSRFTEDVL